VDYIILPATTKMTTRVDINSDLITWAIERAGYELQEFMIDSPNIKAWLDKEKKPTVKQLEKFSKQVHLPFGYLLLDEPPVEELPIPFFRTGKAEPTKQVSVNVYDTVLMLEKRQGWLSEYLEENEFDALPFIGKYDLDNTPKEIADDIRRVLNIPIDWASEQSTIHNAISFLNTKAESNRIFATFNSVVGHNNHRKIKVEECRGFVLVDKFAPFMFINGGDAKSAQMFTFVHELAHIWLGESAGFDFADLKPANSPIEQLCDKVAAEFLVPEVLMHEVWEKRQNLKSLSRFFKVSPIVIGRRAMDLGKISRNSFFRFYNAYKEELASVVKRKGDGGNFYNTAKFKTNLSFVGYVDNAVKQNQLLYTDAYNLTGLSGKTYHKFIKEHLK